MGDESSLLKNVMSPFEVEPLVSESFHFALFQQIKELIFRQGGPSNLRAQEERGEETMGGYYKSWFPAFLEYDVTPALTSNLVSGAGESSGCSSPGDPRQPAHTTPPRPS